MSHERMTTNELFTALQALKEDGAQNLIKELQIQHLELEIQNRELRETQQQLAHSRVRYADLYDFSPIGYASLDEHGVIEEINITGGKLLAENPHKLVGRAFTDFISTADVQAFLDFLQRCKWSRKKRTAEFRLAPIDGSQIDVQLFTTVTQDADRHTLQFRTAIVDVTQRKRSEAAAVETQKKLEQIVAERTAELTSERRQREDAQQFLYEASSVLGMSLDYEITLWTLARAGIPHLADGSAVDMVQEDGTIRRMAVAHSQAEKENALWESPRFQDTTAVIHSGQPLFDKRTMSVPLVIR